MKTSGYIIVEGNIGAGKSTFAKQLCLAFNKAGLNSHYIPEPDEKSNPFLAKYYSSPCDYAYIMQQHLLHKRYAMTQYAQYGALADLGWFVLDRSYFGDICFANIQLRQGFFGRLEYESYMFCHNTLKANLHYPSMSIFLNVSPKQCLERIKRRLEENEGRKCETSIDVNYLHQLSEEIGKLENVMECSCKTKSLNWEEDKNESEISDVCDKIVNEVVSECGCDSGFEAYNPWGIPCNRLYLNERESDFERLAERERNE